MKAHSKAHGVLSSMKLPRIAELYAILNSSTVYYLLDCTSGYHHIALSPEAQKQSAFVTPINISVFKKEQFGLAKALNISSI